ncbi:MAG: glycosyltransferase family 2 protein [Candidatus Omnitrophica bacterium]|nr:glycosyltransferase family 2 protein [Candidatus Omnitrophota bacterium]
MIINCQGGRRLKEVVRITRPEEPLVSIITVVLNGERYLEQTILSVLSQSYKNIEYIVIDGGSVDRTLDIIRKYDDSIDYWQSSEVKGISEKFNIGISLSKGEVIGIINSDDWYELNCVEEIIKRIKKFDVIHGNLQYWKNEKKEFLFLANDKALNVQMTLNHPTVFVKRKLYQDLGIFREKYRFAMDYELLLRFYKNKANFVYLDMTLANMRRGGVSDINWQFGCWEICKAKIENGGNKVTSFLYFLFHLVRCGTSRLFDRFGLVQVNNFYKKRFSDTKKFILNK